MKVCAPLCSTLLHLPKKRKQRWLSTPIPQVNLKQGYMKHIMDPKVGCFISSDLILVLTSGGGKLSCILLGQEGVFYF